MLYYLFPESFLLVAAHGEHGYSVIKVEGQVSSTEHILSTSVIFEVTLRFDVTSNSVPDNAVSFEACHTLLFSDGDVIESVKNEMINAMTGEEGSLNIWDYFSIEEHNGVICLGSQVEVAHSRKFKF